MYARLNRNVTTPEPWVGACDKISYRAGETVPVIYASNQPQDGPDRIRYWVATVDVEDHPYGIGLRDGDFEIVVFTPKTAFDFAKRKKTWDNDLFPETERWMNRCYCTPDRNEVILHRCNELLEAYGIEGDPDLDLSYVNMGDPYIQTVCLHDYCFQVTCQGDMTEQIEKELAEMEERTHEEDV